MTRIPWPTVLGALVSITAVGLGLRFGIAGLAGTIAIGMFALFVSAALVSARRQRVGVASGWAAPQSDAAAGERPPRAEGAPLD